MVGRVRVMGTVGAVLAIVPVVALLTLLGVVSTVVSGVGAAVDACGAGRHGAGVPAPHCAGDCGLAWKVRRNLPICTSSPVTSVAASIRPRLT
jgi:hypothetical protein